MNRRSHKNNKRRLTAKERAALVAAYLAMLPADGDRVGTIERALQAHARDALARHHRRAH